MGIQSINIEMIGQVNYYQAILLYATSSIILGGIVGVDRERKFKSAGIKTHILICMGSTLFTAISFMNLSMNPAAEPNRTAAQIVSGIGFRGAGAKKKKKKGIFGLTTAATIWLVAGLGMAIGSGYPITAAIFTIATLLVLNLTDPIYKLFSHRRLFHLEITGSGDPPSNIEQIINHKMYDIRDFHEFKNKDNNTFTFNYYLRIYPKEISKITSMLNQLVSIRKINYNTIENYDDNGN